MGVYGKLENDNSSSMHLFIQYLPTNWKFNVAELWLGWFVTENVIYI